MPRWPPNAQTIPQFSVGPVTSSTSNLSMPTRNPGASSPRLLGVAILLFLTRIPFLGGLLAALALLVGIGAIVHQLARPYSLVTARPAGA